MQNQNAERKRLAEIVRTPREKSPQLKSTLPRFLQFPWVSISVDTGLRVGVDLSKSESLPSSSSSQWIYRKDYGIPNSDAFEAGPLNRWNMMHSSFQFKLQASSVIVLRSITVNKYGWYRWIWLGSWDPVEQGQWEWSRNLLTPQSTQRATQHQCYPTFSLARGCNASLHSTVTTMSVSSYGMVIAHSLAD